MESKKKKEEPIEEIVDFIGKTTTIENKIQEVCSKIDNLLADDEIENNDIINEAISSLSIENKQLNDNE